MAYGFILNVRVHGGKKKDLAGVFNDLEKRYIAEFKDGTIKDITNDPKYAEIVENIKTCVKNSNRPCCQVCGRLAYEMNISRTFCPKKNKPVNTWDDACEDFEWQRTAGE
jgi:hypothetical protein